MPELLVGDVLDDYEVTAALARGGMASIFKAVERATGRTVALKIPHIQYESDVVFHERFRREEEMALRLDHPSVVKAYHGPCDKSRVYMVLEYVDGMSLAARLHDGRLPPERALDIARQTCEALVYLHAQGVIHRDVKPGNVLLTPAGQVKITDFGIAHVEAARRLTISGLSASVGTPDYMAPEQMGGRMGDARVDVYALGSMLYQMLTGRLPYAGADWDKVMRAKRRDTPPPPSVYVPDVDPALEVVVLNAIQPAPADRYTSAAEMLADLRDPSSAMLRAATRPARRPRRSRDLRPWAAAAAIAVALSGIGWIARLSYQRASEVATAAPQPAGTVVRTGPLHR